MDLGTREIVGYAISRSPNTDLTLSALNQALQLKAPSTSELLVHSDQGCHFSSNAYRQRLQALAITQSMSRKGNCWDNAPMERFFRSLKSEYLDAQQLSNHQDIINHVERYIRFYNHIRRHSTIDYATPHARYMQLKNVA